MDKKILVSCPVNSRNFILPYYLEHLKNLDYPKELISIYWIVNNSIDNSFAILHDFKQKNSDYNSIKIDVLNNSNIPQDARTDGVRRKFIYSWLAELRNKILDECANSDCDFLFSSDSDILLQKDTLIKLLRQNQHIVANLLYNGYLVTPKEPYKFPNILNKTPIGNYKHIVNYHMKNSLEIKEDRLIPVDFTGASFLISKEVCQNKKIKFFENPQGEDEGFCRTAKEQGYQSHCLLNSYAQHVMSPTLLQQFLNNELTMKNIYNLS